MSIIFEYLKCEKHAFELFKAAYKASFPAATAPAPYAELNISTHALDAEADANSATAFLRRVTLDEPLFASLEEGRLAEIEWL